MNANSHQMPAPGDSPQATLAPAYGACPNCGRTLYVGATGCPHCTAIFDHTAVWRVLPDANRVPDDGTVLSLPQPAAQACSHRAVRPRAQPPQALAAQILAGGGVVLLEEHRHSFNPALALAQAVYAWGYACFWILLLCSTFAPSFDTAFTALLLLSPVGVGAIFHLEAEEVGKEVGLRRVQLDLAAGQLSIESRLISEAQSTWRRVPLADLRFAAQLESSYVDSDGFRCRRSPSIRLKVPGDLPHWPALDFELLPADHDDHQSAAAIYAALLAHTGIAPLTTQAHAADAR